MKRTRQTEERTAFVVFESGVREIELAPSRLRTRRTGNANLVSKAGIDVLEAPEPDWSKIPEADALRGETPYPPSKPAAVYA